MSKFADAECGIRQLQARMVDAVWRKDATSFGDCFTEDGEWRIAGMVMRGRPTLVSTFGEVMKQFTRALMTFRTPILEIGNGTASGRTFVTEQSRYTNGVAVNSIGLYFDRFVEQGDRWRYSWHHFQLFYAGPPDINAPLFDNPEFGAPPGLPALDAPTLDHFGLSKKD